MFASRAGMCFGPLIAVNGQVISFLPLAGSWSPVEVPQRTQRRSDDSTSADSTRSSHMPRGGRITAADSLRSCSAIAGVMVLSEVECLMMMCGSGASTYGTRCEEPPETYGTWCTRYLAACGTRRRVGGSVALFVALPLRRAGGERRSARSRASCCNARRTRRRHRPGGAVGEAPNAGGLRKSAPCERSRTGWMHGLAKTVGSFPRRAIGKTSPRKSASRRKRSTGS